MKKLLSAIASTLVLSFSTAAASSAFLIPSRPSSSTLRPRPVSPMMPAPRRPFAPPARVSPPTPPSSLFSSPSNIRTAPSMPPGAGLPVLTQTFRGCTVNFVSVVQAVGPVNGARCLAGGTMGALTGGDLEAGARCIHDINPEGYYNSVSGSCPTL